MNYFQIPMFWMIGCVLPDPGLPLALASPPRGRAGQARESKRFESILHRVRFLLVIDYTSVIVLLVRGGKVRPENKR